MSFDSRNFTVPYTANAAAAQRQLRAKAMVKRKQRELAADHPDDVVSDTSGFGDFELFRDYCHLHPIFKSTKVAKGKPSYNLSQFPRRERSRRRVRMKEKPVVQDAECFDGSITEDTRSQSHFTTHPCEPQNMGSKQETESSDSEVSILSDGKKPQNIRTKRESETSDYEVGVRSFCYGGQSMRLRDLRRSTTDSQKGKLDSKKFEIYMENLWRGIMREKKNVFTYLDSLWFSLYTKEDSRAKVLSWIKKKDIFSKKYVLVPIVHWGHWFLLIFCHFGENSESKDKSRCMVLLDSLGKENSKQLEPEIRRFVFDIFKTEERPENKELTRKIPLVIPKVPQQKNNKECGFFVLYYINLFLESAPDNFSFSEGYPHFMKEDWFTPEDVEGFIKRLDSTNKTSDSSS